MKGDGAVDNRVVLEAYSPRWPELFVREAQLLRAALPALVRDLQHIGSTAVPGLPAKPIIDIALAIPAFAELPSVVQALASLGYRCHGEYGLPGRHFFTKGQPPTHHLHVVEEGSRHWTRWMTFRDLLLKDADLRRRYADHKHALARQFAGNRAGYTAAKDPFIRNALGE